MMPWMSDATLEAVRGGDGHGVAALLNEWLVATAQVFDAEGIHLVVDWHFPEDHELRDLRCGLTEHGLHSCVFNLLCSPDEHLRRDRQREEDARIGAAGVEYFKTEGSWIGSPDGTDIDTTTMTPTEAGDEILKRVEAGHVAEERVD